eukprot:c9991_g1_i1.p1 GENE.c9991_g1_i1~~c9991_g1_i1.p1  ORF type:complete len:684 (+),score=167.43 c9991_g1_i1:45-2096(+)
MSSDVLELFWDLSSVDKAQRVTAASTLVSKLKEHQDLHRKGKEDGALSKNLSYALKRLTRGLCSSRLCSRQGFCLALSEILATFDEIGIRGVWETAKEVTTVTHSTRKDENDLLYGRFFAVVALFKSGRLTAPGNDALFSEILTICTELANSKLYLREVSYDLIAQLVLACSDQHLRAVSQKILPLISETSVGALDLERLMVAIAIEERTNKAIYASKPLLHASHLESLCPVLMSSSTTHPRLHSVWPHILRTLAARPNLLKAFWLNVVENGLIVSRVERSYMAIALTGAMLKLVPPQHVCDLLTPQLLTLIVRSAVSRSQALHLIATHTLSSLSDSLTASPPLALALVMHMAIHVPHANFTALFRLKGLQEGLNSLNSEGLNTLYDFLIADFNNPTRQHPSKAHESSWVESRREWCVEQLCVIARNSIAHGESGQGHQSLGHRVLRFLSDHALGENKTSTSNSNKSNKTKTQSSSSDVVPLTKSSITCCASRMLTLVLDLSALDKDGNWMDDTSQYIQGVIEHSAKGKDSARINAFATLKTIDTATSTGDHKQSKDAKPNKDKHKDSKDSKDSKKHNTTHNYHNKTQNQNQSQNNKYKTSKLHKHKNKKHNTQSQSQTNATETKTTVATTTPPQLHHQQRHRHRGMCQRTRRFGKRKSTSKSETNQRDKTCQKGGGFCCLCE